MARGWTGRPGYSMSAISRISDEGPPPTRLDTRTFADIKKGLLHHRLKLLPADIGA
jgi:hypothetical protein